MLSGKPLPAPVAASSTPAMSSFCPSTAAALGRSKCGAVASQSNTEMQRRRRNRSTTTATTTAKFSSSKRSSLVFARASSSGSNGVVVATELSYLRNQRRSTMTTTTAATTTFSGENKRASTIAHASSPSSPSNPNPGGGGRGEFDIGRLWKEGGGVELTPEEAKVLREAAAKMGATLPAALAGAPPPIPPPTLPPQAAAAAAAAAAATGKKAEPQHSALRDRAQFDRLHASSVATPSAFWSNFASGYEWRNSPATSHSRQRLDDENPSSPPPWFVGGRLNVALNCLDRHVAAGRGSEPAFIWPSSDSSVSVERSLSYEDAASRVAELASWLSRSAGVGAGDAVAIMLPPGALKSTSSKKNGNGGPLLALAFLAVARVGGAALLLDPSAPPEENGAALAASGARVAITASGGPVSLGGPIVPVKERFDAAADNCFEETGGSSSVETVLCFECEGVPVAETPWKCSRDVWATAALSNDDGESGDGNAPGSSSSSNVAAWPDANAPLLLSQAPGTSGSTLLCYPGAGLLVSSGAASRLALDASSSSRVAVASSDPWSEAAVVFGILGPLANGGSVVVLPPCGGGDGQSASAAAGGSWWAAAAKAKTTHVVADVAAAAALARSASSSGGAPPSVVAAMVVDSEPSKVVVESLASSIGEKEEEGEGDDAGEKKRKRRPVVAAWMPAGSGCPLLAGAPFAAEASKPGGMLPWLGCAPYLLDEGESEKDDDRKKKKTDKSVGRPALSAAWPSMARTAMGLDSSGWLRESVFCGPKGEFSPPTALFEVNDDGEWWWAEAKS